MKKIKTIHCLLAILLCFSLIFSFAACSEHEEPPVDNTPQDSEITENPFWLEDDTLKILAIGNSFSDDTMEYVCQIAKSVGIESVYLGNLYIGGCSIDTHVVNATRDLQAYEFRTTTDGKWETQRTFRMKDALTSQNWDFITMQQASGSSGIQDTYKQLPTLVEYVKKHAPQAKLAWNMTWAYQQDTSHGEFYKYDCKQTTMYDMIVATVKSKVVKNENFTYVIPNGTAIQNARSSRIGDHLTRDGYHLTLDLGRYIAGLTLVHTLTEYPLKAIEFAPEKVTDSQKKIAIESAENAVKEPFKVTKSIY